MLVKSIYAIEDFFVISYCKKIRYFTLADFFPIKGTQNQGDCKK